MEEVGIFDNFIELGGDSLSAVEVFVKIEETFRVPFPLSIFFKVPTIAGMAKELERIDRGCLPARNVPRRSRPGQRRRLGAGARSAAFQ